MEAFLCIHGHFYQPPRENPWTGEIEIQPSAAPFHDWNERIYRECYRPNSRARVLDAEGRVSDIVNNFEWLSFNIGPTLMAWLAEKHPRTYASILRADAASRARHGGHGNAIAQSYNHAILPLANRRDKVTEVKWGIADFTARFGRLPEGLWLPETACDDETLAVLAAEGIRFVVLSPDQALAVRPVGGTEWTDVSAGHIDPKCATRCFLREDPSRFVDVFFFDGPVSRAVSFDDVLYDAHRLASRVRNAALPDTTRPQLVTVATDGETFGHHKAYGDRALAYLFSAESPGKNFRVVNFGEYLELHPPRFEVRLKDGDRGGTSWSCAHGTRRWRDHCGCRGGGPAHWDQRWRRPLRESLDWLRDVLAGVFESEGGRLLRDVWQARDAYIEVVLDRSERNGVRFFERHAKRVPDPADRTRALKLLEMQRFAMGMYSSCGWFFSEISGIETVQILQVACRAIELAEEMTGRAIEPEFLSRLGAARSNIAEIRDGRGVWERFVTPCRMSPAKLAGRAAILSLFENVDTRLGTACHRFEMPVHRRETFADLVLNFGRARLFDLTTAAADEFLFVALQFGTYDLRASVRPAAEFRDPAAAEREAFDRLYSGHLEDLLRLLDERFGRAAYGLKDLFLEDQTKVLAAMSREAVSKMNAVYEELYERGRRMNEMYRSINLPLPDEIRAAAAYTLTRRLRTELAVLVERGFDPSRGNGVRQVFEAARSFGVELGREWAAGFLGRELARRTARLAADPASDGVEECLAIVRLAEKTGIEIDRSSPQEDVFTLFRKWADYPETAALTPRAVVEELLHLASALGMNPERYRRKFSEALPARP